LKRYFLPIMGGLGNQFFQFAAALDAAKGNVLFIDCTLLTPRTNRDGIPEILSFALPNTVEVFNKKPNRVLRKILNLTLRLSLKSPRISNMFLKIVDKCVLGFLKLSISVMCVFRYRSFVKVVIPRNVGWYPEANIDSGNYLYGYFQSYKWFENLPTMTKLRNLKMKTEWEDCQEYRIKAKAEEPIILHIRRGDYRVEPGIGLLDIEYYKIALDYVKSNYTSRKVWVFSDELLAAKELLDRVEYFDFEFIDKYSYDSAVTFEIMRMGQIYIIANSSFSYWAATLSLNQNAKVICPDPWFKSELSPLDITPSDWIKIQV
jgi:hypothetical protein